MAVRIVTKHPRFPDVDQVVELQPWQEKRLKASGYAVDADPVVAEVEAGTFDPGEHTVAEVQQVLDEVWNRNDVTEYERIVAAERAGRARVSILNGLPAGS